MVVSTFFVAWAAVEVAGAAEVVAGAWVFPGCTDGATLALADGAEPFEQEEREVETAMRRAAAEISLVFRFMRKILENKIRREDTKKRNFFKSCLVTTREPLIPYAPSLFRRGLWVELIILLFIGAKNLRSQYRHCYYSMHRSWY